MNILVIGSGAREHAIIWKLKQSKQVKNIYCAPANPGMSGDATIINIKETDIKGLLKFAQANKIDLTVVGPEVPLTLGIVNEFEEAGLLIYGPCSKGAMIEGSKIFSKKLMKKYGIPTAAFECFDNLEDSVKYLKQCKFPLVIKDEALAAGKGVFICKDYAYAEDTLKNLFSKSPKKIVIEDFLEGEEVSIFGICDGYKSLAMIPVQDYKGQYDGNKGLNTGGMGSFGPVTRYNEQFLAEMKAVSIDKCLAAMRSEGIIYKGTLYAGLMIGKDNQINVLEYNCRFGDPEAQVLMPLISDDLVEILSEAASSSIKREKINFSNDNCVCVVLASSGYPENYETGHEISRIESIKPDEGMVFCAGVSLNENGKLVNSSGRVASVVAKDSTRESARAKAYQLAEKIHFKNKYNRSDIGL